jgi:hypothetical protein
VQVLVWRTNFDRFDRGGVLDAGPLSSPSGMGVPDLHVSLASPKGAESLQSMASDQTFVKELKKPEVSPHSVDVSLSASPREDPTSVVLPSDLMRPETGDISEFQDQAGDLKYYHCLFFVI